MTLAAALFLAGCGSGNTHTQPTSTGGGGGGVALPNTIANSGADGTVQTVVQSGPVATPMRVTAVV